METENSIEIFFLKYINRFSLQIKMFVQADYLYGRNIQHAGSIKYDLHKVHSASVASNIEKISDQLMVDSQSVSVALRTTSAFHEDTAKVLISNVQERAKDIGEFTLLVTNMGMCLLLKSSWIKKGLFLFGNVRYW